LQHQQYHRTSFEALHSLILPLVPPTYKCDFAIPSHRCHLSRALAETGKVNAAQ
jgi:hypothetical protein